MSIVNEDFYSFTSPDPMVVYGLALGTWGLSVYGAISAFGLISRGLLWPLYKIWFDENYYDGVSTSWANSDSSLTTTWTDDNAAITTSWLSDPSNAEGSYSP